MSGAQTDLPGALHDLLSTIIPYPVFRVLAGFSNLLYSLLGSSNDPTSWTSTLLPPLLTFLLAYTALVIAYRTVRSAISLAWWGIKWGAILGAAIAIWAWWTDNTDAINSVGQAPPSRIFDQIGRFNSLISNPAFSAIYSQLANGGTAGTGSRARQSSPYSSRERKPNAQSRRRNNRRNGRSSSTTGGAGIDDFLPADLSGGLDAFSDLLGRARNGDNNNNHGNQNLDGNTGGVDFASLLSSMIAAGQQQGIDAASALRAAGRVQDEVRKFQADPAAWLDSIRASFGGGRAAEEGDEEPIGSRTRARARRGQY